MKKLFLTFCFSSLFIASPLSAFETNNTEKCDTCFPEIKTNINNIKEPLQDIKELIGFMNKNYILHDKDAIDKTLVAMRNEYVKVAGNLRRELFYYNKNSEKIKALKKFVSNYNNFFACFKSEVKAHYKLSEGRVRQAKKHGDKENLTSLDKISAIATRLFHVAGNTSGEQLGERLEKCMPDAERVLNALEEIRDIIRVERSNNSNRIWRKPAKDYMTGS